MNSDYITKFTNDLKLKILNIDSPSSVVNKFECLLCGEMIEGLPKDKLSKFNKHGHAGCPKCIKTQSLNVKVAEKLRLLDEYGYDLMEEYVSLDHYALVKKKDCCGRTWRSRIKNLIDKTPSCKPCRDDKKKLKKMESESERQMTPEYIAYIRESIQLDIIGGATVSTSHHTFKCLLCESIFNATPKSKVANYKKHGIPGCPTCTKFVTHKEEIENIKDTILSMGFELLEPYKSKLTPTLVRNKNCNCGRTWTTKPTHILSGRSFCKPCNDDKKRKRFELYNKIRHQQSLLNKSGIDAYRSEVRVLTEQTYRDHVSEINPNGYARGRSGMPDVYHLDHIFSIQYCFYHDVPAKICADKSNLRIIPWKQNAVKWKTPSMNIPDIIKPYVSTSDVYDDFYISIIDNFDMDFTLDYVFDNKGKEYNIPLYSEQHKLGMLIVAFDDFVEHKLGSKSYLKNLKQSALDEGINLIIVFEDEWVNNKSLVLQKIAHQLHLNTSNKLYARKCEIREISKCSEFLKEHHIQGSDSSSVKLGAFHSGELVAVMTFCKPRRFMNKRSKDGQWELSRFASNTNYTVVGIASKLLTYFTRNYSWTDIYTYADLRWSKGNLYDSIGFVRDGSVKPNYYYIIDEKRKHRWGYRKDELKRNFPNTYNHNLTEYENMLALGYDRVWDAGVCKYTYIKN